MNKHISNYDKLIEFANLFALRSGKKVGEVIKMSQGKHIIKYPSFDLIVYNGEVAFSYEMWVSYARCEENVESAIRSLSI